MKIKAELYNYSTRNSESAIFPMTDEEIEEIMKKGEIMVDSADGLRLEGEFGMNVKEFNDIIRLFDEKEIELADIQLLSKTYLLKEIEEGVDKILIIDFGGETAGWSSADFFSERDKGRVLYDLGVASFPVAVPEDLEEYMDYSMLWRDAEINLGLRTVVTDDGQYIVSLQ